MRRGRVEIKRIEDAARRQVTFNKRRGGLMKKAHELSMLCDAEVGLVIFSDKGVLSEYCSPQFSLMELIHRYEAINDTQPQETNHDDQQMFMEVERLRNERDQLEAILRRQTGEDLPPFATADELNQLQLQIESAHHKVRERKDELLSQRLEELHSVEQMLQDQNSFLQRMICENERSPAAAEASPVFIPQMLLPAPALDHSWFVKEEATAARGPSSTGLQLWPHLLHGDADHPNL